MRTISLKTRGAGGKLAAICAAPAVLHSFGLLAGAEATCHPSVAGDMAGVRLREERVVVDGDIVTSRSAGTAMEFALRLVSILEGEAKLSEVKAGVLPGP